MTCVKMKVRNFIEVKQDSHNYPTHFSVMMIQREALKYSLVCF